MEPLLLLENFGKIGQMTTWTLHFLNSLFLKFEPAPAEGIDIFFHGLVRRPSLIAKSFD